MLVKATTEDIEKYGDFAYELALDQTCSCYPAYADGIKTREDFDAEAYSCVTREDKELLLFLADGQVEGWIGYFWIPQERYLQLQFCNIRTGTERALSELLRLLRERFSGYTLYFGFPGDNTAALDFLAENRFECIEDDWNYSFVFDNYHEQPEAQGVARIGRENFEGFRAVYRTDPETYWNSDRILEHLDEWLVYVAYEEHRPVGAVCLTGADGYYEIYGLEISDSAGKAETGTSLLVSALNQCRRMGVRYLTFLCEEDIKPVVESLGFRRVGRYVLSVKLI